MDLLWMDAYRAQPPDLGPIAAMRAALGIGLGSLGAAEVAQLREAMDLAMTVPAVRARMLEELARTTRIIAEAAAERAGKAASDFDAQVLAGAVVGVAMAAWFDQPGDLDGFASRFERGLALLEAGLPL